MKKLALKFGVVCFFLVGLAGCSSTPDKPVVETTAKFNVNDISLTVVQLVTPDIEYHTNEEIQTLVAAGIKANLEQANLLTTDSTMNSLEIKITYHRRFMGDQTPVPSDSLGYPTFDYDINVKDGDKLLTTISKQHLMYDGGFAMNLKAAGGLLRAKSDETVFFDALSRNVANSIEKL